MGNERILWAGGPAFDFDFQVHHLSRCVTDGVFDLGAPTPAKSPALAKRQGRGTPKCTIAIPGVHTGEVFNFKYNSAAERPGHPPVPVRTPPAIGPNPNYEGSKNSFAINNRILRSCRPFFRLAVYFWVVTIAPGL
jgi:hypothetical protein